MKTFIEMPAKDGGSVIVAVDVPKEVEEAEPRNVGVSDYFKPKPVDENFDSITDMIVKYSKPIIKSFEALAVGDMPATKASAEFGLSFTGKGSVYLVESTLEASIKVNIEWEISTKDRI